MENFLSIELNIFGLFDVNRVEDELKRNLAAQKAENVKL